MKYKNLLDFYFAISVAFSFLIGGFEFNHKKKKIIILYIITYYFICLQYITYSQGIPSGNFPPHETLICKNYNMQHWSLFISLPDNGINVVSLVQLSYKPTKTSNPCLFVNSHFPLHYTTTSSVTRYTPYLRNTLSRNTVHTDKKGPT